MSQATAHQTGAPGDKGRPGIGLDLWAGSCVRVASRGHGGPHVLTDGEGARFRLRRSGSWETGAGLEAGAPWPWFRQVCRAVPSPRPGRRPRRPAPRGGALREEVRLGLAHVEVHPVQLERALLQRPGHGVVRPQMLQLLHHVGQTELLDGVGGCPSGDAASRAGPWRPSAPDSAARAAATASTASARRPVRCSSAPASPRSRSARTP